TSATASAAMAPLIKPVFPRSLVLAAWRRFPRAALYGLPYGWRSTNEAPERRPHLPALAHPRAHFRLPARGRMGAANAGRPGGLPSAGAAVCLGRPVAKLARRRAHALGAAVEDRGAA